MKQKDYEVARIVKERLSRIVQLIDLKIYGSRARGNADEDSDLDVFIEVGYLDKVLEEKIYEVSWEVGFENNMFISPLIFTRYEIEESPLRISPIVENINKEGVKI